MRRNPLIGFFRHIQIVIFPERYAAAWQTPDATVHIKMLAASQVIVYNRRIRGAFPLLIGSQKRHAVDFQAQDKLRVIAPGSFLEIPRGLEGLVKKAVPTQYSKNVASGL